MWLGQDVLCLTVFIARLCREHFRMKKQAVTDACHQWLGKYDATTKAIQAELDKLT